MSNLLVGLIHVHQIVSAACAGVWLVASAIGVRVSPICRTAITLSTVDTLVLVIVNTAVMLSMQVWIRARPNSTLADYDGIDEVDVEAASTYKCMGKHTIAAVALLLCASYGRDV